MPPVTGPAPEQVVSGTGHAASMEVEVGCPRERVFAGFVDGDLYSRACRS